MAKKIEKGLFITFEGPEGSGKSTHVKRLAGEMREDGYDVIHAMEPGDTELGRRVREILLDKDDVDVDKNAELFLFEADRAQHVGTLIKPALEKKKIVLCDRFNTATFAYQGFGLGLDMQKIKLIDEFATGGLKPDMTIILDIDAPTGLGRAGKVGAADKIEKRSVDFHERVRKGYLTLAEENKEVFRVIDASLSLEEVYSFIKKEVYDKVQRYTRSG